MGPQLREVLRDSWAFDFSLQSVHMDILRRDVDKGPIHLPFDHRLMGRACIVFQTLEGRREEYLTEAN